MSLATGLLVLAWSPLVMLGLVLLGGGAKGLLTTAPAAIAYDVSSPATRGTVMGISQTSTALGHTVGPLATGLTAETLGYVWAFVATALFFAACAFVTRRILRHVASPRI